MQYYSAVKRKVFESVLMRWMNLEPIIQSEVSQKEKISYLTLAISTECKKMVLLNYLQSSREDTDPENRPMDRAQQEEKVGGVEKVTRKHTLPRVE